MLEAILDHIHNDFSVDVNRGRFTISSGMIDAPGLLPGQFFRIRGSVLNDGVYRYPTAELQDEEFTGAVEALAVPRALVQLSEEVRDWVQKHPETDLASESFGGYQYSRATDKNGTPLTWQEVFRSRLNVWRKMA